MVASLELRDEEIDRIFHALADSTRRDIVRRSIDGEFSVSALARLYPMSTTAIQKHVATLERAGLIQRTRSGREQLVKSRRERIATAGRLLDQMEALWRDRIEQIDELLKD